jgi:hypothetical protein
MSGEARLATILELLYEAVLDATVRPSDNATTLDHSMARAEVRSTSAGLPPDIRRSAR